ncbi:hypothetical protein OGAPHI_000098 [Ogataea philodendri]|uniref:Uncharacterized protein n=1 Tax=Ogataea philodendri TaxID=1378263 RepID=A0A9P8PH07_9ASCO|nr:uncharacterized protein OGAPHI_000098 [Ogataea philodendri]KAH3671912.1 hypothetical protein OGAPHI_000098 [Ogataea philodendri]
MELSSGSSWSTSPFEESPTHKPPYSLDPAETIPNLRSKVIRRQSNRLFPTTHWLVDMMEERLVRWRPASSQNNIGLALDGTHPYQQDQMTQENTPIVTKNKAPDIESVKNESLVFPAHKPDQLLGNSTLRWIQDLNSSFDVNDFSPDFAESNHSFKCLGTTTVNFGNQTLENNVITASPLEIDRHMAELTKGQVPEIAGQPSQFNQNEPSDELPWYDLSWMFGCY